jgi:phage tail tape measure protein, TP901 family, core region
LRNSLIDLTREIPLSFAEISKIATLGAQMGIGAGSLDEFTKTVASFSAVTGSTVDETAEAFGRISSLAGVATSDFENLVRQSHLPV